MSRRNQQVVARVIAVTFDRAGGDDTPECAIGLLKTQRVSYADAQTVRSLLWLSLPRDSPPPISREAEALEHPLFERLHSFLPNVSFVDDGGL